MANLSDAWRESPHPPGTIVVDAALWIALGAMLVATVAFVIALGVVYYGDSYAVPAWNERSVPAPIVY